MVGRVAAYNQVQSRPNFPIISRLTSTAAVWYTCPAGKKARVTGYAILDALGAAVDVHIERNPTGGNQVSTDLTVVGQSTGLLELDLVAGDTLGYDQNSGTNATIDGVWSIAEYDA